MMRLRALISLPTTLFLIGASLAIVDAVWYDPTCPKNTSGCQCLPLPSKTADKCCCVGKDVRQIPANLSTNMTILLMSEVGIEKISATDLLQYKSLEQIDISKAKELISIDAAAFDGLDKLRKLSLSDCSNLRVIEGTLLEQNTKIQVLTVTYTALESMPTMRMTEKHFMTMLSIDFSNNKIQNISSGQIYRISTRSFRLDKNELTEIGDHAFNKCKFVDLNLAHNQNLKQMSKGAFEGISVIHNLDLSDTAITELPTEGIKELKTITIRDTHSLKQLPSILAFTNLQEAKFTYPYHCCLFKHAKRETERSNRQFNKNLAEMQSMYCGKGPTATPQNQGSNAESRRRRQVPAKSPIAGTPPTNALFDYDFNRWGAFDNDSTTSESEDKSEEDIPDHTEGRKKVIQCHDDNEGVYRYYENITCTPHPNALNPCEDVVGYPFLRVAIWLIWMLAIVGNIGVWIVLIIVRHPRMRVHYFFMMNLALADLMTGVYLAMLAIQDIRTSGEYYNYAVEWQMGMGCKVAGFISVFASELSIITMFLISFEIWYNTKYIIYGKRLQQRVAWILMILGYIFSAVMATLPLLGVSSYSPTSICLPLDIEEPVNRAYIVCGLLFNVLAFFGMAANYGTIYCTVHGSASPSTRPEDIQVAKKMALLIGTDFLCWCPTIVFGLTAALQLPLISISVAKIFLVLFYPINAFANPFLYVFLTKIIRNDIRNIVRQTYVYKKMSERHSRAATSKLSNPFDHFYNSAPPGTDKRQRNPSVAQSSTTYLQVTQSTSVGTSPRGSNCSSEMRNNSAHSLELLKVDQNQLSIGASTRPTPRVSFNDDITIEKVDQHSVAANKRKPCPIKPRVSAVPQMSDISENSHSGDDHLPRQSTIDVRSPISFVPRVLKPLIDGSLSNGSTVPKSSAEGRPPLSILANGRKKTFSYGDEDYRGAVDGDEWRRRQSVADNCRQSSVASSGYGSMRADSETSELSQRLDSVDLTHIPLLSLRQTAQTTSVDRCSISPSIESGYSGTPDATENRKMNGHNSFSTGRTTPVLMVSDFSVDISDMAASWV